MVSVVRSRVLFGSRLLLNRKLLCLQHEDSSMGLSTATCDVLKICKPLLEENRNQIGVTFYKKLFDENPGLRNTFNMSHQRPASEAEEPSAQQLSLSNALIAYCANCDQLEKLGPFVERVANKHVSFDVQPEHYPVVGGVLLATLEEVLGTETFSGDVKNAVAEAYFFLADIFINKESGLKKSLEAAPGGWSGWRKLKLVDKMAETPLHMSLMFAPEDGGSLMSYQPGQYLSLRLDIPGTDHQHCRNYSLSDGPGGDRYRITVKREERGTVSGYLHDSLELGDIIEAGVPCGDFVLVPGSSCVFLGAGIGITPLLSMMKVSAANGAKNTLIYRASNSESHPFRQEIETAISSAADGSTVHWMYSCDKIINTGRKFPDTGYGHFLRGQIPDVDSKYCESTLSRLIPDKESKFYICGPGGFISDTIEYLDRLGVAKENVLYENFGPQF